MIQNERIRKAYYFAKSKHDATGAIRKHSGEPYIVHPCGVANLINSYGGNEDEIICGFLHDTVEDTNTTVDEIADEFGWNVALVVEEVTNATDYLGLDKETYMNVELMDLSSSALLVKLCDIYYNLLDYPGPAQKIRMLHNILYLIHNRKLNNKCAAIAADIKKTFDVRGMELEAERIYT